MAGYYKVTYNQPGWKSYQIIVPSLAAESKWHAIDLAYQRNAGEYPERKYYKAKLLK